MEQENKENMAKELTERLSELEELGEIEKLINNNCIEFEHNNIRFRVRRPNCGEKIELEKARNNKYVKMLQDDNYKTREELTQLYAKRGIDVLEFDRKMDTFQAEINNLKLSLAQVTDIKEVDIIKNQIFSLMEKQAQVSIEKSNLLQYSLEDQLSLYLQTYLPYLLLEKEVEKDKWIKYFNTYEELEHSTDDKLIGKSHYYLTCLIHSSESSI